MSKGKCRITNEPLTELFSLGKMYPSDFVDKENIYTGEKIDLAVGISDNGVLQLMESYPPEKMYEKYWYNTSINESMRKAMKDVVDSAINFPGIKLVKDDVVLDIASNSGELLTNYPDDVYKIGIDPCDVAFNSDLYAQKIKLLTNYPDDVYKIGIDPCDVAFNSDLYAQKILKCETELPTSNTFHTYKPVLINDYYSAGIVNPLLDYLSSNGARIITCCAMFYDLENPVEFCKDVKECLLPDGLFVLQLTYGGTMYTGYEFSNIGEEHLIFYSLYDLLTVINKAGLNVWLAELNDVNCGSIRLYITHKENKLPFVPDHTKNVWNEQITALWLREQQLGLDNGSCWVDWFTKIKKQAEKLKDYLVHEKAKGKKIVCVGMSTKGNVILQFTGLDNTIITAGGERSAAKIGLYTKGTGIPIVSEEEMRAMKPDIALILPYTFLSSILSREHELLDAGCEFIVPLPEVRIYNKHGSRYLGDEVVKSKWITW